MPAYKKTHVMVELELTPRWWMKLTQRLCGLDTLQEVRVLHAKVCEVAFKLGDVGLLKTKRSKFVARVRVPIDMPLAVLCEKAGAIVDELNALDVSCLAEARAKYL